MKKNSNLTKLAFVFLAAGTQVAFAGSGSQKACEGLPTHAALTAALKGSVPAAAGGTLAGAGVAGATNGGLDIPMWASVVARDGTVCAVTFSGTNFDDQWPASRVISAQKANTSNSLTTTESGTLDGSANKAGVWSTARLYSSVQPGASLFGLQESNPVDPAVAYKGPSSKFGQPNDPMVGKRIGGINVFGGGLALFNSDGKVIGGLGVSGDTSCADHNVAWRVRKALVLNNNPGGAESDNILFDFVSDGDGHFASTSGFGHPNCLPGNAVNEIAVNDAIVP